MYGREHGAEQRHVLGREVLCGGEGTVVRVRVRVRVRARARVRVRGVSGGP